MLTIETGVPALSTDEYLQALVDLAKRTDPTVFELKTRLPLEGRADVPVAATNGLSVILKAYSSGGENELHAHVHEDHVFVVLQGEATFYGEGDRVIAKLRRYQGILVPKAAFYKFEAGLGEQLVMLRVGAVNMMPDPNAAFARVNLQGIDMDSYSAENKEVPLKLDNARWFPPKQ